MEKNIIIWLLVFLIIYILLISQVERIKTYVTFSWIWTKVENFVWHIDSKFKFEEINIKDKNNNNINWLYIDNKADKTVYYFHGNWLPIDYYFHEINYIAELWYNVMAYDYPWYGKSLGFPNKNEIDNFSEIFYEYIKKEKDLESEDLIVWWRSVWAAVATDFASKNNIDKLILVSPWTSRYEMSRKKFWFSLQNILLKMDSYVSKELVKKLQIPVLIIHWNNDEIIPFDQWRIIFNNYWINTWEEINKNFIEINNFWHNGVIDTYWHVIKYKIEGFLNSWKLNYKYNYIFLNNKKINKIKEKNIKFLEIKKRKIFIDNLDLKSDNSITKFVNNKISFDGSNTTYFKDLNTDIV